MQPASWVVWEEGGRVPDLIIELSSESTREVDFGRKKRAYESIRVFEYFIYDPDGEELVGYRLSTANGRYQELRANAAGRLTSQRLGLELGLSQRDYYSCPAPILRWFTPDGELVPTGEEEARRLAEDNAALRAELERLRSQLG